MLLDPDSVFFDHRYREVGKQSASAFRLEVAQSVNELLDFVEDHNRKSDTPIDLRISKIATTCFLYRADHRVLAAFLLNIRRSMQTVHIEFDCRPGSPALQLIEHIDSVFRPSEGHVPVRRDLLACIAAASKGAGKGPGK